MDDSECPLTNNAAERVLRNYILMRKCCYVTRSYRATSSANECSR
ncbi:IS66 family transposase [Salinivibrio costicola]|nr:transposase [Salinivibrio costicola]